MGANDPPDMANLDLRAWLARFMQGITKYCYIHNIIDVGLMFLEGL